MTSITHQAEAMPIHMHTENFNILIDDKFPTACLDCARCHRKCDRNVNGCAYCVRRGKLCEYKPRQKVSRKSLKPKKTKDLEIIALPTTAEAELTRTYSVSVHHEYCVNQISFFLPLMSQESIVSNLEYIRAIGMGEKTVLVPPKQEELALTFSILSNSLKRIGKKQDSYKMYTKGRDFLFAIFDDVQQNFEVASCYAIIAELHVCSGDNNRAAFYLRNVDSYLTTERDIRHPREKYLLFLVRSCKDMMNSSSDLGRKFKLLTGLFVTWDRQDDVLTPEQIDSVILEVFAKIEKAPSAAVNGGPLRLNILLLAQGMKLQYYKTLQTRDDQVLLVANSIADLVLSVDFNQCTQVVATALIEASTIHIQEIKNGNNTNELCSRLKLDLHGLEILADRFEIVNKWYRPVIKDIVSFLQVVDPTFILNK